MKKLLLASLVLGFSGAWAIDSFSCKDFYIVHGKKLCQYNGSIAAEFAKKYYALINKSNRDNLNPFGFYSQNCTHFVSQAILAGFVGRSDIDYIYASTSAYDTEYGEPLQWYFRERTNDDSSKAQRGANALYKYAKVSVSDLYKRKYNGIKFKFITRDYISSYDKNGKKRKNGGALEVDKIKVGDIIFLDYKDKNGNYSKQNKPLKDIKTDGIIDHSLIVTGIQGWRLGYNQIRVTGNTKTYTNIGLGDINEASAYKRKVEFYVYRPYYYIEKP